jgi:hypothetical protein
MTINNYDTVIKLADKGEVFEYHVGYLPRDRFFDNHVRDKANLLRRLAESDVVELYQKRLTYGNINNDPKFQYLARKI